MILGVEGHVNLFASIRGFHKQFQHIPKFKIDFLSNSLKIIKI